MFEFGGNRARDTPDISWSPLYGPTLTYFMEKRYGQNVHNTSNSSEYEFMLINHLLSSIINVSHRW
jgi:hypothetical protein